MREIVRASNLLLVLAVCNAQPCQTEASILLEGEIDGLGQSKVHRSAFAGLGSSRKLASAHTTQTSIRSIIEVRQRFVIFSHICSILQGPISLQAGPAAARTTWRY